MKRRFLVFTFLTLAASGAASRTSAQASTKLTATFIGNEAWHITDGEYVLLTDFPYESGAFGYMSWDWSKAPEAKGTKVALLITHEHRDHFAPEHLARIAPGAVIGAATIRASAGASALTPGAAVSFGPMTIESIATPHAGLEHYSHIIEWHGVRLYAPGDTEEPDSVLKAKNLDVAFVTPWMLDAVRKKNARINARRILVVHHKTSGPYEGAETPKQGEVFTFARASAVDSR
jgi:L-ascorbate metabolism protein UlaG (beta-lactamase superfamily)